ncbi:MAG: HEPN domain-containing protein [Candidatus Micrarchaeota archaeon]
MNIEDCFKENLLKKTKIEEEKIKNSLNLARHFLERAEGILKIGYYDIAFSQAYNSMFHSARAILFKDGIKERSHYCLVLYLKNKFKSGEIKDYLEILDDCRQSRHNIQYEGGNCAPEDAEQAIEDAKKFLEIVEGLL